MSSVYRREPVHTIRESIKLAVPVGTACSHWLQHDEFPRLLRPLQLTRPAIERGEPEWDSETIERRPDRLVLCKSAGGGAPSSAAEFVFVSDHESHITVSITLDREQPDLDRRASRHLHEELAHFKRVVEDRASRQ